MSSGMIETNTLHVAVPAGKGPIATWTSLACYGEHTFDMLPREEEFPVKVVFFDIRDAARAFVGLQASGVPCRLAPQTGSCSVRIAGKAQTQVDVQAWEKLIRCRRQDEGAYILDFFDVRDATSFQAQISQEDPKCTTLLPLPPGLEDIAHKATHCVTIEDLPSTILITAFFEAVLQQAGLGNLVVRFSVSPGPAVAGHTAQVQSKGKKNGNYKGKEKAVKLQEEKLPVVLGSATVYVSSGHGAEICRHHFHGRMWGTTFPARVSIEALHDDSTTSKSSLPMTGKPSPQSLSAQAPVFTAGPADAKLSLGAPEFRPAVSATFSASTTARVIKQQAHRAAWSKLHTVSETSTDAGESSEWEAYPLFSLTSQTHNLMSLLRLVPSWDQEAF